MEEILEILLVDNLTLEILSARRCRNPALEGLAVGSEGGIPIEGPKRCPPIDQEIVPKQGMHSE